MKMLWFIVLVVAVGIPGLSVAGEPKKPPGVLLRIAQTGMQYAANQALDDYCGRLTGQTIPDQSGKADTPIGHIDWELKNTHVTSIGKPKVTIKMVPNSGVRFTATGGGVGFNGDWKYKYRHIIHITDSGSFDLAVSGIDYSMLVTLGATPKGEPTISASGCSCSIGDVHIHFHGGASWLYNIFDSQVEKAIKHSIQDKLCSLALDVVNKDAAERIKKTKMIMEMHDVTLDFHLLAAPAYTKMFMDGQMKGEVFWKKNFTESSLMPTPMVMPNSTSNMVYIMMSDYAFITLTQVMYEHGALAIYVNRDSLPAGKKSLLNTTCTDNICIGKFVTQLAKKYPNKTVEMALAANAPPKINMVPGAFSVDLFANLTFLVKFPDNSTKYAFTLNGTMHVDLVIKLRGNDLIAHVSHFSSSWHVIHSAIGPISDSSMNFTMNALINSVVLPTLKFMWDTGFRIPSIEDTVYVNPTIKILKSSLLIATDVYYKPKHDSQTKKKASPLKLSNKFTKPNNIMDKF